MSDSATNATLPGPRCTTSATRSSPSGLRTTRSCPGGVYLVAETDLTGDPEVDEQNPFAGLTHVSALLHFIQDNLAAGGHGETPSDGLGWVEAAFDAAGFETTSYGSETGYRVFVGTEPITS